MGYNLSRARTVAFNLLVIASCCYAANCRFLRASSLHPRVFVGNPYMWISITAMIALNLIITYVRQPPLFLFVQQFFFVFEVFHACVLCFFFFFFWKKNAITGAFAQCAVLHVLRKGVRHVLLPSHGGRRVGTRDWLLVWPVSPRRIGEVHFVFKYTFCFLSIHIFF